MNADAGEVEDASPSNEVVGGRSQFASLLVVFGDAAFTGAAGVHLAFADGLRGHFVLLAASALTFIFSTVAASVATRKVVVLVAAMFIALSGVAAAGEAVAVARRYDTLRHEAFGDRAGPRLVEPYSDQGRRMGGAMLGSIAASLAAISALPLAVYFAVRAVRTKPEPTT